MVLGKRWLFLTGNGAEIRPLEMDRKSPEFHIAITGRITGSSANHACP